MNAEGSAEQRRAAFELETLPLMKTVYNRAMQLTRQSDVAADLVQETFLRAFRTFDNFRAGTDAKAWLLTILYSRFISRYRKQQREPDEMALEAAESTPAAGTAEPLSSLDPRLWASDEVYAALTRLPDDFRVVLLMVDVDELSYAEVAAVVHCPIGTVRSRLSRARRMTYAALEQYARARGFLGREQ